MCICEPCRLPYITVASLTSYSELQACVSQHQDRSYYAEEVSTANYENGKLTPFKIVPSQCNPITLPGIERVSLQHCIYSPGLRFRSDQHPSKVLGLLRPAKAGREKNQANGETKRTKGRWRLAKKKRNGDSTVHLVFAASLTICKEKCECNGDEPCQSIESNPSTKTKTTTRNVLT